MISVILGNDADQVVDEYVLGFMMSICPYTVKPLTKFNYAQFLANNIHLRLSKFETSRYFGYQCYLVHLCMLFEADKFSHIGLKTEDEIGNLVSVIHHTSLVRKRAKNVGFS